MNKATSIISERKQIFENIAERIQKNNRWQWVGNLWKYAGSNSEFLCKQNIHKFIEMDSIVH